MTHVWPTDDDFAAGTTAFGDYLGAYLKCAFWASLAFPHPTTGSYTAVQAPADLTDLYSPGSGPIAPKFATPDAACAAYLWRAHESSADATVTLGFQSLVLSGNGHDLHRMATQCWVAARVNGSTYTSATNQHVDVQSGYFFGFLVDATREATWYLVRLSAGVVTVLDSRVFNGTSALLSNEIDPRNANELTLTVEDAAGDVQLVASYTAQPQTTGSDRGSVPVSVEVFDVTDASGSKITGAGRFGFAVNGKQTISGSPGGAVAGSSSHFQIVTGGTLRLRDEWQRIYRPAGAATNDTIGSVSYFGRSMLCAWAGDFFTVAPFDKKIRRSAVGGLTDRINFDPVNEPVGSGSGAGSFLASNRRATDLRSQNRSVQFRFGSVQQDGTAGTTDPTPNRFAGIFIRGGTTQTPSNSFVLSLGYQIIAVRNDAGPTAFFRLLRWRQGVPTTLAEKLTGVTLNQDTNYLLRFDAFNLRDAGGNAVGPPTLRVFLDGVQVVLEQPSSPAAGVTITAGGTVQDGSGQAVISGPLEGVCVFLPNGDRTIFLDSWAEGALTNSDVETTNDHASIAVPSETDDDSGETWAAPIDWPVEELNYAATLATPMESGHVQTHDVYSEQRRAWRIGCAAMTDDERDVLLDLWAATDGVQRCFTFAVPVSRSGETVKARFVDPTLGTRLVDKGVNAYGTIEVEEALA